MVKLLKNAESQKQAQINPTKFDQYITQTVIILN